MTNLIRGKLYRIYRENDNGNLFYHCIGMYIKTINVDIDQFLTGHYCRFLVEGKIVNFDNTCEMFQFYKCGEE